MARPSNDDLERAGVSEKQYHAARAVFWCAVVAGIIVVASAIYSALWGS